MLGTTRFAIGCSIVWGSAIVAGQLLAPGESQFYGLAEEEQKRMQIILGALSVISIGAFVAGFAALFLTYLTNKAHKRHEAYLRNHPEVAAADVFTFDEEEDDLEEMSDDELLAEEAPAEQLPDPEKTDELNSNLNDDDKPKKVSAD